MITVEVTDSDIAAAEFYRGCANCPVDRALQRVGIGAHVAHDRLTIQTLHGKATDLAGLEIPLPNKAKKFLKMFDHRRPVKPFSFELNID
jgi:hypothetical protein